MIASTQTNHPLAGGKTNGRVSSPIELATAKLKSAGMAHHAASYFHTRCANPNREPYQYRATPLDLGAEGCDLVTVYRCMAAFEEIGLVRRAFFHNGSALYEINLGQPVRYHVVCKATDRVEELDAETSAEIARTFAAIEEKLRERGYTGVGHIREFFGIAPQTKRVSPPPVLVKR